MKPRLIIATPFEGEHPTKHMARERYAANKAVADLMLRVWGTHDGPLYPTFRFLHRKNGVVAVQVDLIEGSRAGAQRVPRTENVPHRWGGESLAFHTTARILDPAVDPFIYAPLINYARQQMEPAPTHITVDHYENRITKLVDLHVATPGGAPKDQGASI